MNNQNRDGNSNNHFAQAAAPVEQLHPEIWFMHEDINDADRPYMMPLLHDSFELWFRETSEETEAMQGSSFLFDWELRLIDSTGAVKGQELLWHEELRLLAAQVAATGSAATLSFGEPLTHAAAVPVRKRSNGEPFSIFIHIAPSSAVEAEQQARLGALHFRSCFYRAFEHIYVRDLLLQQTRTEKDAQRRDALFLAAKRLYDQFDVTAVLSEMLSSLGQLYPSSEVNLYLSQDHLNGDARVKPLIFKNAAHDIVAKAFMEGKPMTQKERDGTIRLAVPMNGKQAAYGVLCISIDAERWDIANMPAFVLLADTAGSAFENAKLYEQSNLLINELRVINELAKRLNQSLKLKDIFKFATNELLNIFEADYCSILQLDQDRNQFNVMSSNIPTLAREQFVPDYGFSGIINRTKEPLILSDYWQTRVVTSKMMDHTGSRSLIAAPIMVEDEVVGVIMVTHKSPHYFSYDNYKLLQIMSTHIALAVTNASLHAEVRRMVITDNLTGLHARHYLNEQILSRQRKDPLGSLVLVDVDHFKRINDTFGHQVGDRILIQVSEIIRTTIRQGDIAARWGGEELAVYLPGIRSEQAFRIAERIRLLVEEETDPKVTVSCGVSEWTFENEKISVESLFYRADMALYDAKNNGRNCIRLGVG